MNTSHGPVPEPHEIPPFHSAEYIDWLAKYGDCAEPGWCDIHGHEDVAPESPECLCAANTGPIAYDCPAHRRLNTGSNPSGGAS